MSGPVPGALHTPSLMLAATLPGNGGLIIPPPLIRKQRLREAQFLPRVPPRVSNSVGIQSQAGVSKALVLFHCVAGGEPPAPMGACKAGLSAWGDGAISPTLGSAA